MMPLNVLSQGPLYKCGERSASSQNVHGHEHFDVLTDQLQAAPHSRTPWGPSTPAEEALLEMESSLDEWMKPKQVLISTQHSRPKQNRTEGSQLGPPGPPTES